VTGCISNSGSISGGSNGILLSSSTVTGDISNSGSISGGTAGISLSSSTVTGSITNSGTISGGTNAIRVSADSTLANLDIGGNNTASFVGAVSAANTAMSILSGATYTLNTADDFTVASFTNNGTARFAAGVASSFDLSNVTGNTFTNNGVLEVGAGGTGTITGDYTQTASGIFQTTASSGTSFGKLAVSGTATLAAGTGIKVNAASGNTLAAGNTLASVISAGTLSASTFTVSDNSFLFDFTAAINGNAVDLLTVAASSDGSGTDTDTDTDTGNPGSGTDSDTGNSSSGSVANAIAQTGFSSGRGAAVVLDGFVSGGTTGTDMDNVVTALGQLSTAQEVSDAVAETLPLLTAGMNQVALNAMHGTNRVIQSRQASNLGMSSGDEFLGDSTLWLKPVGSWATQDTHESVAGFDAVSHGLIGGLDGKISDDTRIGVALAWMHSNVDGKSTSSGNSADIDAYQAILYGSHNLSAMPDTTLDWQADIGTNQNKGQRVIGFMDRVATSDYDSLTAHLGAGLSRDFQVSEQTTLTPGIRADYTWIRDEGYTETGAGALNLKVKQRSTDELILLAEGSVAQSLTDRSKLLANLGVGYDVLNGQNSLTSSYVGGGTAFATQGLDASPWLARGGVGLVVKSTQNTEITARYDVETREDFLAQTASLNVRWDF
jgi:outer membrane autotransporter protein